VRLQPGRERRLGHARIGATLLRFNRHHSAARLPRSAASSRGRASSHSAIIYVYYSVQIIFCNNCIRVKR
jgi:hypothetical protein